MNSHRRWLGGLLGAGMLAAAAAGVMTARAGAAELASGTVAAPWRGVAVLPVAADGGTATGGSSQDATSAQDAAGTADAAQGTAADPSSLTATFVQRLAEALGLTRDRVDAAIRDVLAGMVDEAAQKGQLSSEQAAALRQRIAQGQYRLVPPMGGRGHGWGGKHGRHGGFFPGEGHGASLAGLLQSVSDTLNLTPGQILDQLWQGKTLAQIAQEQGVSRQQVKDAIVSQAKQRLDAAVTAGRLTQQQADQWLQRLEEQADALLDRQFTPPGAAHDGEAGASGSAAAGGTGPASAEPMGTGSRTTGTWGVIPPEGGADGVAGVM
ncbi:hypothetical protein Tmar_1923 [Thermaerobacter marianensis DSM 12885]|uniref:DUF2680 domain-containing protein n=1 Tax=Thermaerobacter marianensis (strain ATCC 700841 / DSM 12885 / JCM 10246 / 7p75a) TaxID=644966 RepID=E6SIR4_THEM7|nr:hypothetical protein [Thermaerobacter marianensis]ADU52008.1 hypothetical protein Tmar_1923 [Thermaerobacter marianensis DSM 12885]